jgi:hypothetical protein
LRRHHGKALDEDDDDEDDEESAASATTASADDSSSDSSGLLLDEASSDDASDDDNIDRHDDPNNNNNSNNNEENENDVVEDEGSGDAGERFITRPRPAHGYDTIRQPHRPASTGYMSAQSSERYPSVNSLVDSSTSSELDASTTIDNRIAHLHRKEVRESSALLDQELRLIGEGTLAGDEYLRRLDHILNAKLNVIESLRNVVRQQLETASSSASSLKASSPLARRRHTSAASSSLAGLTPPPPPTSSNV